MKVQRSLYRFLRIHPHQPHNRITTSPWRATSWQKRTEFWRYL